MACVLVLAGCAGLLLWQVFQLRQSLALDASRADPRGVADLLASPLASADGGEVILRQARAESLLLFVFTPSDCAPCLAEIEALERIRRAQPEILPIGLMAFASADEARQTQKNFQLGFPILLDPDGSRLRSLRLSRTPWKILIQVNPVRVILQDPPSETDAETAAFEARVLRLGKR